MHEGEGPTLQEENRRLNRELAAAQARIRSLQAALDELRAYASHDIRTPLVVGLGYVELLLDGQLGPLTPQAHSRMQVALKNLRELATRIDALADDHQPASE